MSQLAAGYQDFPWKGAARHFERRLKHLRGRLVQLSYKSSVVSTVLVWEQQKLVQSDTPINHGARWWQSAGSAQ